MTDAVWVTPGYPWDGQPVGGVFFQTQARALVRLGVGVTVACPTPWAPWPVSRARTKWRQYAAAPKAAFDEGVAIVRPRYLALPGEPSWSAPDRQIAQAAWRARSAWKDARLIHGHSAITGLAAWRLARRTGLPYVLTVHGSDLNTWPLRHPDRIDDLRTAFIEAGRVIAVSAALAERVDDIAGVKAIHLAIGSDHASIAGLSIRKDEARRILGLDQERVVILFVGNLLPSKGVRALADAILTMDDRFIGVFVGDGPEAGYRSQESPNGIRLVYRGARPHSEIATYMSAADVLVLPSHREGLPTVLVEAGSIGLPVIATAVGGIPGLLGRDRGSLIPDASAESIRWALVAFDADRPAAAAAADRLRTHVLAEHDVDANAVRLRELYDEVTAGEGRSPG